jgi:hypothetical protein
MSQSEMSYLACFESEVEIFFVEFIGSNREFRRVDPVLELVEIF